MSGNTKRPTRRDVMVTGSAAAALLLGSRTGALAFDRAPSGFPGKTPATACASRHAAISASLGRFSCEPANETAAVNRAIASACCPDCGVRITWDGQTGLAAA